MSEPKAPPRPTRTKEDAVNELLRRVLLLTLTPQDPPTPATSAAAGTVYLEQLAAELLSEGRPLLLSSDVVERGIMARLQLEREAVEAWGVRVEERSAWGFCLGSYGRAVEEGRKIVKVKDAEKLAAFQEALQSTKQLLVSYAAISLQHPDSFPDYSPKPLLPSASPSSSPLTDPILARFRIDTAPAGGLSSEPVSAPVAPLPAGFLEDLVRSNEEDGLDGILGPVYQDLSARVRKVSLLGPFLPPLRALSFLVSLSPAAASALVSHHNWLPPTDNGRLLEAQSLLGPFLRISVIPDPVLGNGEPNIRTQLFSRPSQRRASEISSSYVAVRTAARQLWEGLTDLLLSLLKTPDTRDKVLDLLAAFITTNASRSAMQSDPLKVASHGLFFNLSAVMLKLCEPFLDPSSPKLSKIDPSYVLQSGGRLNFRDLTALHATSSEVASWVDSRNYARQETFRQMQAQREKEELDRALTAATASSSSSPSPSSFSPSHALRSSPAASTAAGGANGAAPAVKYSFICECFFMTARILNLGLLKIVSVSRDIARRGGREDEQALEVLEAMRGEGAPADLEQQIERLSARVEAVKEMRICYDAAIRDPELIQQAICYYHVMVVWLVSFAAGFKLPLPVPCPMEFASLPEHFAEDMVDCLILASSMHHALDTINLDDFMSFLVMFMGSPLHIKNPYLRAKMVDVLQLWMPKYSPTPSMRKAMESLFEGHPLAMAHLTPNLLRLYVDIEFTGAHNAFYEKFTIRFHIAELLEYLWEVPSHRQAWEKVAREEERGFYLRFLSLLLNDSIYLLDEALEKIPKLREEEAAMSRRAEWLLLEAEERRQREETFQRDQSLVRYNMQLSGANVRMLQYSTTEIVKPFLLPELVDRVASMLNYFLLQLVGSNRRALKLSHPEKFDFHPRKLLSQIVEIYANIAKGEGADHSFAVAICSDSRSYREESFPEAARVVAQNGLLPAAVIQRFEALGREAKRASEEAEEMEEDLDDVPTEFLDPVQFTIMKDPVKLPSNNVMERSVILRHLLSDPKDPFTRAHLTPDMLVPHDELRAKINEFLAQKKAEKKMSIDS